MTIAKKQQGETPERAAFTELNALYQELQNDFSLDTLSMGMSADYRLAIAESYFVRLQKINRTSRGGMSTDYRETGF